MWQKLELEIMKQTSKKEIFENAFFDQESDFETKTTNETLKSLG
jgi:hypothetical protein